MARYSNRTRTDTAPDTPARATSQVERAGDQRDSSPSVPCPRPPGCRVIELQCNAHAPHRPPQPLCWQLCLVGAGWQRTWGPTGTVEVANLSCSPGSRHCRLWLQRNGRSGRAVEVASAVNCGSLRHHHRDRLACGRQVLHRRVRTARRRRQLPGQRSAAPDNGLKVARGRGCP